MIRPILNNFHEIARKKMKEKVIDPFIRKSKPEKQDAQNQYSKNNHLKRYLPTAISFILCYAAPTLCPITPSSGSNPNATAL